MNILIVGNGFDLAHGLPTTYSDFLGFIEYFERGYKGSIIDINNFKNEPKFKKLNKIVQLYLLSKRIKSKEDKLINELYNIISSNVWIYHLRKCSKNDKLKGKNWIDFEYEISEVIRALECLKNVNIDTLKQGSFQQSDGTMYSKACDFFRVMKELYKNKENNNLNFEWNKFYGYDAKKIIDELNDELNRLIRCLEIYLEDIVGKIVIQKEKELIDIHQINKIDKLISFNYTDTFERVYDKNQEVEYDYIHGKLDISRDIEENNMVLGIDEYLKEDDKNKELDFIQFKKFFQRIYKKTGCRYKKWLEKAKEDQKLPLQLLDKDCTSFANNIYIWTFIRYNRQGYIKRIYNVSSNTNNNILL